MAVRTNTVTVGTSPTRLDVVISGANGCAVYNDAATTIYIGGPNVTATGSKKGGPLATGQWISFDLGDYDELYGIVATGTGTAIVTQRGVA